MGTPDSECLNCMGWHYIIPLDFKVCWGYFSEKITILLVSVGKGSMNEPLSTLDTELYSHLGVT